MRLSERPLQVVRWSARTVAAGVVLFGLPFYLGYGNPLPFRNPDYSIHDNTWLMVFPLMFVGLALGWRFERLGGWLVTIPLVIGLLVTLATEGELVVHMLVPLVSGLLYLVVGYGSSSGDSRGGSSRSSP